MLEEYGHGRIIRGELFVIGIWDAFAQEVSEHLQASEVTVLRFPENRLSAIGMHAIASSLPLSKVEKIIMNSSGLHDEHIKPLWDVLRQTNLKQLNLSRNNLRTLDWLIESLPGSSLESLNLSENLFSEEDLLKLLSCVPETRLRHINYEGICEIPDEVSGRIKRVLQTNARSAVNNDPNGR